MLLEFDNLVETEGLQALSNHFRWTMDLDLAHANIDSVSHKADGSLISTFLHDDLAFCVKSKGSLFSDQAIAAMKYLSRPENAGFQHELATLTVAGYTVDMEYVAPHNRIVLGYEKENMIVLSIRDNETGNAYYLSDVKARLLPRVNLIYFEIVERWTGYEGIDDKPDFLATVPAMEGIEGFVVRLKNGTAFKLKTDWYLVLHKTKDSINSPRKLFECVIQETTDDLRQLFRDDVVALKQIKDMEDRVVPKFAHMVKTVEQYFEDNKHLSRKDYAIKGQGIDDGLFGLKMTKYIGKTVDYKVFAIKHPELFGIKEEDAGDQATSEE